MRNNKTSNIKSKILAFTLLELIVSLLIWTIVLIYTFSFVWDTIAELSKSNRQSKILSSFYEFNTKLNNYRNLFVSSEILIDNDFWDGSDILLLRNPSNNLWVIFWVVNKNFMKLENISDYDTYYYKVLWYWELSNGELSDILSNPSNAYNYTFYSDKLFDGFTLKDFQLLYFKGIAQLCLNF